MWLDCSVSLHWGSLDVLDFEDGEKKDQIYVLCDN